MKKLVTTTIQELNTLFLKSPLILVYLILISLILKYRLLTTGGLWFDEVYGIYISELPIPELLHKLTFDYSPPLFYLILHIWIKIFGNQDFNLRLLPLLTHLITIPTSYLITQKLYNRPTAILSTTIITLSGLTTYYAIEVRMYSLVLLISIINTYFFLKTFEKPTRHRILGFIATTTLGLYTHHSFTFIILSQLFFLGGKRIQRKLPHIKVWINIYVATAILYFPTFFTITIHQLDRLSSTMEYTHNMGMSYSLGQYYLVLLSNILLFPYLSYTLGTLILLTIIWACISNYRKPNDNITYSIILLIIPSLIIYLRTQNTVTIRYLITTSYALSIILSTAIFNTPIKSLRISLVAGLLLTLTISNHFLYFYKGNGYNYKNKQNAAFLAQHNQQAQAIITVSAWYKYPLLRYAQNDTPILGFEPLSLINATTVDDEQMITRVGRATVTSENAKLIHQFIQPYNYIWYYNPEHFSDPNRHILKELTNCHQILQTYHPEDIYATPMQKNSIAFLYYIKVNHRCPAPPKM